MQSLIVTLFMKYNIRRNTSTKHMQSSLAGVSLTSKHKDRVFFPLWKKWHFCGHPLATKEACKGPKKDPWQRNKASFIHLRRCSRTFRAYLCVFAFSWKLSPKNGISEGDVNTGGWGASALAAEVVGCPLCLRRMDSHSRHGRGQSHSQSQCQ